MYEVFEEGGSVRVSRKRMDGLIPIAGKNLASVDNTAKTQWLKFVGAFKGTEMRNLKAGKDDDGIVIRVREPGSPASAGSSQEDDEDSQGAMDVDKEFEGDAEDDGADLSVVVVRTRQNTAKEAELSPPKAPRRGKDAYVPYDANRHKIWAKPVSLTQSMALYLRLRSVFSAIGALLIPRLVSGQPSSLTELRRVRRSVIDV